MEKQKLFSFYRKNGPSYSDGLVQSSNDLETYFAVKDDSFLAGTYGYKNMKGEPFANSYEELFGKRSAKTVCLVSISK